MTEIPIPQCVTDKILELNRLAEKYPISIPVTAAAEFLGCDGESARAYLMTPYSFGMGWRKGDKLNRGFHIPTAKFYLWYRNIAIKEV